MSETKKTAPARPCPICGKPAVEDYKPFCSKCCADVDLNRWLKGGYAIPGAPDAEEDGEPAAGSRGYDED
jgi:endogenous inhibitor of DNA gyrase (YacG/DUF329 family)